MEMVIVSWWNKECVLKHSVFSIYGLAAVFWNSIQWSYGMSALQIMFLFSTSRSTSSAPTMKSVKWTYLIDASVKDVASENALR